MVASYTAILQLFFFDFHTELSHIYRKIELWPQCVYCGVLAQGSAASFTMKWCTHSINQWRTPILSHIRVLARSFPKGTVPFGAPNVPFGSAPKPIMCPLAPPQNQHIFNSHLNYLNLKTVWALNIELSEHWTELKCFVDSGTHATNVWYWQSLHSRWWAWSWDTICALWPVNSGENTALLGSKVCCPLEDKVTKSFHSFSSTET